MLTMFRRRCAKVAAEHDAAKLIKDLGELAYAAAGDMSWREDAGLLASRSPGHWHRVQQEIARRLCHLPSEPMVKAFEQPRPSFEHAARHVG